MNIIMSGLEHSLVSIELRERLSFTKVQTGEILRKIRSFPHVLGCVLISTCNRTELYLSCTAEANPGQLLCQAAGEEYTLYQEAFVTRSADVAVHHLMEVAAGLRSRIWGEDQIISQVKGAIGMAREAGAADSVLETLFRSAISAGKEVRTQVHLTALPTSAASMAVALLEKKFDTLQGKRAIVIGNGEMGRLSASLLQKAGCDVKVTLRSYRHGETVVPPGCGVVPYDERYLHMDGLDLLVSATTSPHYTVTTSQVAALSTPPSLMVDLAIPRDIQPEVGQMEGIFLYNVDDLGNWGENRMVPSEVTEILQAHEEKFHRWLNYKDCLGSVESLKQAICERLLTNKELESGLSEVDVMALSVDKTVDLLVSGLAQHITAETLSRCEQKIRSHTTGRPVLF